MSAPVEKTETAAAAAAAPAVSESTATDAAAAAPAAAPAAAAPADAAAAATAGAGAGAGADGAAAAGGADAAAGKQEAAAPPLSAADLARALRQLEFYFSDSNLPRDKFLLAEVARRPGGWVPLTVLTRFKRLAAITADPVEIRRAALGSRALLECGAEGSPEELAVRRREPLPETDVTLPRTGVFRRLDIEKESIEDVQESVCSHHLPFFVFFVFTSYTLLGVSALGGVVVLIVK
jgi:hypothetical protein